jgi:glycerate dehydrogenase
MKIVVLDGHTLNPGDLDWSALQALGDCVVHPRIPASDTLRIAADAEVLISNKVLLTREHIAALPKLRYIGVTATGYNNVDVAAARERGILVTNVPAYSTKSVAQHVFALLLEFTHHTGSHSEGVRAGRWAGAQDWSYQEHPLLELDGLTLGIVGYGRIGAAVGAIGAAMGMRILATPPRTRPLPAGVDAATVDELFERSDVISLHCALTPETRGLVNEPRLNRMKSTAFLINTARGPLIDETALARALNSGRIAGAGLDVLSTEPPSADNPLLTARNCIITPHLAWATRAARTRLMAVTVENVRAFLNGTPQNVVS